MYCLSFNKYLHLNKKTYTLTNNSSNLFPLYYHLYIKSPIMIHRIKFDIYFLFLKNSIFIRNKKI